MNNFIATITSIKQHESLYLLELNARGVMLSMLLFDLNPQFKVGCQVSLLFKETEVLLAKNLQGVLSIHNRFTATITHITEGIILSTVMLKSPAGELYSIITTNALHELALHNGEEVTVLLKASQISLEMYCDEY